MKSAWNKIKQENHAGDRIGDVEQQQNEVYLWDSSKKTISSTWKTSTFESFVSTHNLLQLYSYVHGISLSLTVEKMTVVMVINFNSRVDIPTIWLAHRSKMWSEWGKSRLHSIHDFRHNGSSFRHQSDAVAIYCNRLISQRYSQTCPWDHSSVEKWYLRKYAYLM